jgi:hypothetical protein
MDPKGAFGSTMPVARLDASFTPLGDHHLVRYQRGESLRAAVTEALKLGRAQG